MIWYKQPAVLIIGSGRSGTSTVARLCHTRLRICMGHVLKQGDALNPEGYYEDWISHSMIQMMVNNGSFHTDTWLEAMNFQHQVCPAWGVKDPWVLFLQPSWGTLNPGLVIHCERNIDSTVTSWLKVWQQGNPKDKPNQQIINHYTKLTHDRQMLCQETKNIWQNHITINFDTPQEEYKILERIEAKLPEYIKESLSNSSSKLG
jgi:hypothetical protein